MAFCPSCGSPVDAGSTSCAKCGGPSAARPAAPVYVTAPSPHSGQPGGFQPAYGAVLPDPSPMALILAAASWVICGPVLSIPAVFMARSNIRGVREGRFNPNSLSMSQLAFWVAAINVGVGLISIIVVALIFGGAMFFAATVPHTMHSPGAPSRISGYSSTQAYESIEKDVESRMAARPESERKLWRQTRDDLRTMRRQRGSGTMPEAKGFAELLRASDANEPLWVALTALERKAAVESGRIAPVRPRPAGFTPAEAPPGGTTEEEDEDD
ncbi:MAG: hypothetical protein AAB074_15185 [Planctomycetota bacterium]